MTNFEIALKNFSRGLWSDDMLTKLVNKNKLTMEEYKEIVGALPTTADLASIKSAKVIESKEALEIYLIENPMTWVDGNQYNVTAEKQSLLTSQLALYQTAVAAGQPYELKWNTTGGKCTIWEYENLVALALAIGQYVQPLVSYQQTKEVEIMACKTVEEIDSIVVNYETME